MSSSGYYFQVKCQVTARTPRLTVKFVMTSCASCKLSNDSVKYKSRDWRDVLEEGQSLELVTHLQVSSSFLAATKSALKRGVC